jgi:ribosome-interacting GTPase 1
VPANLSPEYKKAEAAFRAARDPKERLDCLNEMLRTIPKHKGTEHLQAEIKTRIKHLTEELATAKKKGGRRGPTYVTRPEGAAQVAFIGAPNVGKSALHARLTGSSAEAGAFPFTTQLPLPGMLAHEDIHFQLVDLPPVCREHPVPWIGNALRPADACLLIVDMRDAASVDHVVASRELLAERRITLLGESEEGRSDEESSDEEVSDPFAIQLPTLLLANKADLSTGLQEDVEALEKLIGIRYPFFAVSAKTGEGLERIAPWLFEVLGIVRVYTKAPGRPLEKSKPFTVRRGATVYDVAKLVHGEIAGSLKYARLWGGDHYSGQQVGRDNPVSDGDVLELHA